MGYGDDLIFKKNLEVKSVITCGHWLLQCVVCALITLYVLVLGQKRNISHNWKVEKKIMDKSYFHMI